MAKHRRTAGLRIRESGPKKKAGTLAFVVSFLVVFLLLGASGADGAQVTLLWDPSPDAAEVTGYYIYYGTASRTYTSKVNAGNVTTYTVSGLSPGVTYYFAATAYTGSGLESDYSNELSYTVPSACTYSLAPAGLSVGSGAASGTIQVTTQTGCAWTASSGAPWFSIVSGGSGTGSGTVRYSVAANTTTSQRTAVSSIAGKVFTVTQAAAPVCTYSISPTKASFRAGGGTGRITVTTQSGCAWTASSQVSWMTLSRSSGTGSGTISYTVRANTTRSSRTGTAVVAGRSFTVTQSASWWR